MFELLLVILVVAILASIAYPSFITALERAKVVKDMNNLRQIGLATLVYLNDNSDVIPASGTWPGTSATPSLYPKYISTRKIFQSPFDNRLPSEAADGTPPVSYGINANIYAPAPGGINGSMASVASPSSTILMAPNYPHPPGDPTQIISWPGTAGNAPNLPVGGTGETKGTQGNGQQINALFCDAHIEALKFVPPPTTPPSGAFQDTTSTLGQKHWDPTK